MLNNNDLTKFKNLLIKKIAKQTNENCSIYIIIHI